VEERAEEVGNGKADVGEEGALERRQTALAVRILTGLNLAVEIGM
jgi:hypothetical protein